MSEENLEIVRGVYNAWQKGDFEAALEPFDEDVEWFGPPDISRAGGGGLARATRASAVRSVAGWAHGLTIASSFAS